MYLVQMFAKVQWILPCDCVKSHCEKSDYVQKQREHLDPALASDNENYLSVQFQVKEYVLAKFAVGLIVPPYILKTDNEITVDITTRYSYGKPVIGSVVAQLNIKFSLLLSGLNCLGDAIVFICRTRPSVHSAHLRNTWMDSTHL